MISFACSACGKKLKVNDSLAGKTGRCPHCQGAVRIPAAAAGSAIPGQGQGSSRSSRDEHGPTDVQDAATILPGAGASEDSSGADTQGWKTGGNSPSGGNELTDFLSPPQRPGELGGLGSYRVLKILGAGGMGVVYKAEDPHLQRAVALKAMLPGLGASASSRQRFLREARAAAAVKHDHIVTIYQVGEDRGVPFLAMEFLEGQPLDERLKHEPRLPIAEVLRIGREISEGLQAAHERGLIHRDIKPANIWLEGKRQRVKILDFGLARPTSGEEQITQQGAILGTPAYMAPEQGRGETVDNRCDLFSLGCVLYRMAAGEIPFKGKDTISTLMAVAMETPAPLESFNPEVPPGLVALVNSLLEKQREDRPASAAAVAAELEALQKAPSDAGPTVLTPPPPPAKPRRTRQKAPASRMPWTIAGIGAAVLVLGGIVAAVLVAGKGQSEKKVVARKGSAGAGEKPGKAIAEAPPVGNPPPVSDFFTGKNLDGWEGLRGLWSVKDGVLIGATEPLTFNTFLCSKKKYRDFELKCQVRLTGNKANSGIQVRSRVIDPAKFVVAGPQGDMGEGYWGSLYGEKAGGMMKAGPRDMQKTIKNGFNDYSIKVVGKHVTIKVNGRTSVDDNFPTMPDEGIIAFQLHSGLKMEAAFRNIEFTELQRKEKVWTQLFNGKDLSGWKVFPSGTGPWTVENGVLVGRDTFSHLFSERDDYENFRFRVEAMINHGGNSGQYFRTQFGPGFPKGYEAQINSTHRDPARTGSLYGAKGGTVARSTDILPDTWFTQEVVAVGDRIVIKVNGKTSVDVRDTTYRKGRFALQIHNPGTVVKFRKIEVQELKGE